MILITIKKSLPDNIQAKFDKIKTLYSPLNGYKNYRSFSGHEQSIPIIGMFINRNINITSLIL